MTVVITWSPISPFTIVTLDMGSATHVGYSDVVLRGAFAVIKNYAMIGLATTRISMSLLKNLNYRRTQQTMPIWNGFHLIVLRIGGGEVNICMVYPFVNLL